MNPPPFKERIKNILIEYNLLSSKSRELLTLQFNKNKRRNCNNNNNNNSTRSTALYLKHNNFYIKHSKPNECVYDYNTKKKCLVSYSSKKIQKRITDLTHEYKQQIQLNVSGKHNSLPTEVKNANNNNNIRHYTSIRLNSDIQRDIVHYKPFTKLNEENTKEHNRYLKTISMYSNYKPKRRYYVSGLNDIKGSFYDSPYKKKDNPRSKVDPLFETIK